MNSSQVARAVTPVVQNTVSEMKGDGLKAQIARQDPNTAGEKRVKKKEKEEDELDRPRRKSFIIYKNQPDSPGPALY